MPEALIDFSDPKRKAQVIARLSVLKGMYRMSVVKHRPRRSDRQNRFMWGCFVQPFATWLTETQGETYTADDAHEVFKSMFLGRDVCDPKTGEVIGQSVRSTTTLSTTEFNEYLDHCAEFLARMCGIVVPEPGVYHEEEPAEASSGRSQ
jgi:hypothetical protein